MRLWGDCMEMIIGAAIFATGAFFGAWFYVAGQQAKTIQNGQRFQDAILKNLERSRNEQGNR